MENLFLFITINKKSDSSEFIDFFLRHNVAPIYSAIGRGAATSETLSLFGLEQSEKVLTKSIVTKSKVYELKGALTREMSIDLPDRGIALAIPLSSLASKKVLSHIIKDETEENASASSQA